ncbi:MAG: OsmC family peroxiredoxin [Flavobacteriales bacterium]|jgi:uncharacterized OsmC-like protein|nr:MAG: OsmC family peroxiredoxin [Flavobacteriales bacterium]
MYAVTVQESPVINVKAGRHEAVYAVDGSAMNPLEALYAALAGCAAVFAKKACKELGISPLGIDIHCKPFAGPGGPLTLSKFKTEVRFPEHFSAEQRATVLEAIRLCAVKKIVEGGAEISFSVDEA